jgi:hypothetical protein
MKLSSSDLDTLSDTLSRLSTKPEKATAAASFFHQLEAVEKGTTQPSLSGGEVVSLDPPDLSNYDSINKLLRQHEVDENSVTEAQAAFIISNMERVVILDRVPCAFANPSRDEECDKEATKLCSACKLVKYCSEVRVRSFLVSLLSHIRN